MCLFLSKRVQSSSQPQGRCLVNNEAAFQARTSVFAVSGGCAGSNWSSESFIERRVRARRFSHFLALSEAASCELGLQRLGSMCPGTLLWVSLFQYARPSRGCLVRAPQKIQENRFDFSTVVCPLTPLCALFVVCFTVSFEILMESHSEHPFQRR